MEIYGAADRSDAAAEAASAFFQRRGVDPSEWQRYGFRMEDREALRHLLEVAAGIDSQMLGETEIFGQVKRAYASAQARGSTGPVLNRVFQKAFQAAKRARTETAITSGQVSVSRCAVDLALNVFGSLGEVPHPPPRRRGNRREERQGLPEPGSQPARRLEPPSRTRPFAGRGARRRIPAFRGPGAPVVGF